MRHFKLASFGFVLWIITYFVELPFFITITLSFISGSMFGLILKDLLVKEK